MAVMFYAVVKKIRFYLTNYTNINKIILLKYLFANPFQLFQQMFFFVSVLNLGGLFCCIVYYEPCLKMSTAATLLPQY